jgi:hypothetical protein
MVSQYFITQTHPMQTPDHPTGCHCHTFDMNLLEQAVAVEVDIAVRKVCRERGVSPSTIDQNLWVDTILVRISTTVMRAVDSHTLLATDIDALVDAEIARLIDRHIHRTSPMDAGSFLVPAHGLLRLPRHAGVLWRKIFEKHIE